MTHKQIRNIGWSLVALGFLSVGAVEAKAAPFSKTTLRYDRMKTNTPSTLQLIIVPATAQTESKLVINFGGSVTIGAGQSATTTSFTGVGVSGLPGTIAAAGAGTSIAITGLNDLAVGATYGVNLTVGITTQSAVGTTLDTITSYTAGNAVIDQTKVQSAFISNDQVVITANVPPTFTFSLGGGGTDSFTTDLSPSAVVSTNGILVSASTNAARGWTGWVKSQSISLGSVSTGETIPTIGTAGVGTTSICSNGADCYLLDATSVSPGSGTGSFTADVGYAGNGTTSGGTLSTNFLPFASRTGKTNGDTITLKAHSSIIATKAAGSDYTDTWTVVGAGNF